MRLRSTQRERLLCAAAEVFTAGLLSRAITVGVRRDAWLKSVHGESVQGSGTYTRSVASRQVTLALDNVTAVLAEARSRSAPSGASTAVVFSEREVLVVESSHERDQRFAHAPLGPTRYHRVASAGAIAWVGVYQRMITLGNPGDLAPRDVHLGKAVEQNEWSPGAAGHAAGRDVQGAET